MLADDFASEYLSGIKKGLDEIEKNNYIFRKYKEIAGPIIQKEKEFAISIGQHILKELEYLKQARFFYDGCNAGVRFPEGGIKIYRNRYCQTPPPPPPPPNPENEEHAFAYCANGSQMYSVIVNNINQTVTDINGNNQTIYLPSGTKTQEWADVQKQNGENRLKFVKDGMIANNTNSGYEVYSNIRVVKTKSAWVTSNLTAINLAVYTKSLSGAISSILNGQGITLLQQLVSIELFADWRTTIESSPIIVSGGRYSWLVTQFQSPPCPAPVTLPPPPPPPDSPPMDCCEELLQLLQLTLKRIGEPQKVTIFDEDLERKGTQKADKTPESLNHYLKLAVERTEIVNRLIGIDNFPVTVPDTMITPFKEGVFSKVFKFIDGNKKRKINSLTEFIAWMSEQDSAVLGEFHQVIQFEDENKKASQVVLPNVAEALKEIVLLTAQMAKQNNTQTELIFKIAAETIATKAVASRGTEIIQDIQDYLDYPTERKTKTIPTAVSLPKVTTDKNGIPIATAKTENHNNFLKAGKVEFVYEDWTGSNSLHDQMLDLLQLAAMLRAIYYQRTDKE